MGVKLMAVIGGGGVIPRGDEHVMTLESERGSRRESGRSFRGGGVLRVGGLGGGCGKTGTSAVHQLSRSSAVSASPRTLLPPSLLLLSVVAAASACSLPPPPPPSPPPLVGAPDGLVLRRGTLECEWVFGRRPCGRRELLLMRVTVLHAHVT